ncbi:MAG: M24 family metallopeptidase [Sphingomonadaceae bacterium]
MNVSINYPRRIWKVQQQLAKHGIDVYVSVRQASLHYLLGAFAPWRTAVVVPQQGDAVAVLWNADAARLRGDTWFDPSHIVEWGNKRDPVFIDTVARVIKEMALGDKKVALELTCGGPRVAPGLLLAFEYQQILRALPEATFVDGTDIVDEVMVVKEKEEIELMRQAAAIGDIGLKAAVDALRVGVTENYLAGVGELAMRKAGSEWSWSVTAGDEVGSGYRTAYPVGITQPATEKMVQLGDMVILDFHPMYRLYFCDLTANAILGKPTREQQRLAEVWQQGVQVLLRHMLPGAPVAEAARATHQFVVDAGLGEYLWPAFGHGLGTDSRVPPLINEKSEEKFQENMTVAAGLHIYWPGVGGMRLELPTLVTPRGGEPLAKTPLYLQVVEP